ncbi:MAG: hypothetical protein AAGA92_00745 [Planctomycetota bacterium]
MPNETVTRFPIPALVPNGGEPPSGFAGSPQSTAAAQPVQTAQASNDQFQSDHGPALGLQNWREEMRRIRETTTQLLLLSFTLQTLLATDCRADHFFGRVVRLAQEKEYHGTEPATCKDGAVEQLAENIDWLEHHIDKYGSVVAKQPDIWGEARLTKHRDEYERILYQELNQFEFKLNAAIRQSDQSFASAAVALGNATSTKETTTTNPETEVETKVVQQSLVPFTEDLQALRQDLDGTSPSKAQLDLSRFAGGEKIDVEPTVYLDQLSRYVNHLHELRRINEGDDTSDSPGYALNLVRMPVSVLPGKLTRKGWGAEITITAEPVLSDDLLPTTFRNLVINDLVDQLRLPMVKMVEQKTWKVRTRCEIMAGRKKLASEIKDTEKLIKCKEAALGSATEELGNKVDENSTLYNEIEENKSNGIQLKKQIQELRRAFPELDCKSSSKAGVESAAPSEQLLQTDAMSEEQENKDKVTLIEIAKYVATNHLLLSVPELEERSIEAVKKSIEGESLSESDCVVLAEQIAKALKSWEEEHYRLSERIRKIEQGKPDATKIIEELRGKVEQTEDELVGLRATLTEKKLKEKEMSGADKKAKETLELAKIVTSSLSSSRSRRARHPLPPTQAIQVLDIHSLKKAALEFCGGYQGRHTRWAGYKDCDDKKSTKETRVHVVDAQRWLQAEIEGAYELLSDRQHTWLWYRLAHPDSGLVAAIHGRHIDKCVKDENQEDKHAYAHAKPTVESLRNHFFKALQSRHDKGGHVDQALALDLLGNTKERHARNTTEALAWAIVVESALLNHQLNEDIRKTAVARECHCINIGQQDMVFFLPASSSRADSQFSEEFMAATKVFQDYVRCRWPIHVFALDPVAQDQNVADFSARRRELQLALSLGFVKGEIGANALMNHSRQLETDIETISLNRTIAGFGHGNDTFGWRFYPRVQTLDQPGAVGSVWQSFRGTPRDHDLRKRQLEQGMRECVAIVLMPSFVPYADFDVRSNWFRLTNPKNAALTMKDTVRLSRAVTAMERSKAQCAQCAHHYRDGEVRRLLKRVHQLDRELPLQTMRSQIPYENTLGGFEMFNTGVTDLAPELIGWYGAPGVVVADDLDNRYHCGCYSDCEYCREGGISCERTPVGFSSLTQTSDLSQKAQPFPLCDGEGTTLFLVGDNFSVHDTKVIAGGVCIPHVRLISREIMRVTIPSCVNKVNVRGKDYVALYASTPYGVTNHLHVPVHSRKLDKATKTAIAAEVEKQIKDRKIPKAEFIVKPSDSEVTKLKVEALCEGSTKRVGDLSFRLMPGEKVPGLKYTVENALGYVGRNQEAVFKAAVYNGQFFKPLFCVKTVESLESEGSIPSSDLEKLFDAIDDNSIVEHLKKAVGYEKLSKDGKVTVKLVFFVELKSNGKKAGCPPQKVPEEIDIEVSLACKCCDTPAAGSPTGESEDKPAAGDDSAPEDVPVDEPVMPAPAEDALLPAPGDSEASSGEACGSCNSLRVIEGVFR